MSDNFKIAKDLKYLPLYIVLGFRETKQNVYEKKYNDTSIIINVETGAVTTNLNIINTDTFILNDAKAFIILECVDRLLNLGYSKNDIILDFDNEFDIYIQNTVYIKCMEKCTKEFGVSSNKIIQINYSSKLYSGLIERTYFINDKGDIFNKGFFNSLKGECYNLSLSTSVVSNDFIIDGDIVVEYIGNSKRVIIPEGIKVIGSLSFWDNSIIEEVVAPQSLELIGGDAFVHCKNLTKFTITKNVVAMGNNPFSGCPKLVLKNESSNFIFENDTLYTKDKKRIIYFEILSKLKQYTIEDTVEVIGKHAFYLSNLELITIPHSVVILENNPFSGCSKLKLDNHSKAIHVIDDVLYDKYKTSVIGALNSISTDCLVLEDVKVIKRNAFYNCKGIKKIVFPKSLEDIGYNPFVGCSNIEFEVNDNFKVLDGLLYTKDMSKLICCPINKSDNVVLPESVITLERGAFSGSRCKSVNLKNVSVISKNCFTNSLIEELYCSDLVCFIGEWCFAHCYNLTNISINKECYIDTFAFSNCNTNIVKRETRDNYVIESDNIYTLKSMINAYSNKIDSILIDPPYNSNIDYIGYKDDNFSDGYSAFMKDRIELSYKLLSNEGHLIINIDEGEVDNLVNICKSIFGANLVNVHKWKKLHEFFDTNRVIKPGKKEVVYEYIIVCSKTVNAKLKKVMQPYILDNTLLEKESDFPKEFDCFGTNSSAKDEINDIFGNRNYFSTPKPLKLIKEFIRATTKEDSIVLDFFGGSGTTGHACIDLCSEDNINRNYIVVSNSENNICNDVTLKRIKMFDKNVVSL